MSKRRRALSLLREAGGAVLSIPARIAQLRAVAEADSGKPAAPKLEQRQPGQRRRLVRTTILNAAQSLRAPIVGE